MSRNGSQAAPSGSGVVKVRVLPKGAGLVFTGDLEAGVFTTYARGAVIELKPEAAQALEERGLVEIQ